MMRMIFYVMLAGWMTCRIPASLGQSFWIEKSFQDFADGRFLDAGSNLYVAADGRMQMITRWDFNGDGYPDILLPSGHGHTEKENTYIYLNNGADIDARSRIDLPGCGTSDGLLTDFNKDGWNDLAVSNRSDSHVKWVNAWIYHGSSSGFSAQNRTVLPAYEAGGLAAGDFNGDSWIDLAIACQWQTGTEEAPEGPQMSLVYWNSPDGFREDHRTHLALDDKGAIAMAAADLDQDNIDDLVCLAAGATFLHLSSHNASNDFQSHIRLGIGGKAVAIGDFNGDHMKDLAICSIRKVVLIPGTTEGYSLKNSIELTVDNPRDVILSDIDGDGLDDVIVANYSSAGGATWTNSYVHYSDGADFSGRRTLALPTLGASGVSAGDLNGDGLPELVISNQRVTNQSNLNSYVFWNKGGRFYFGHHTQLPTEGSVANTIGDVNNDGMNDVIFFNTEGMLRDGLAESYIYWGDGSRHFSPERRTILPTHQIFGLGHADLDDDGHVDLILCQGNFINGVTHEQGGLIIYWGDSDGFSKKTILTMQRAYGGVRIADINRDGYLDILSGGTCVDIENPEQSGFPIFWGSANGFQQHHRTVFQVTDVRVRIPLLMDLNKDGWLDMAGQVEDGKVRFWWGSGDGFHPDQFSDMLMNRKDHLMYIKGADLNRDGWLDLLLPNRGPADGTQTTSFIYYGSPGGFSVENCSEIPCYVTYQNAIADFDRDGWLDIFLSSYGGEVQGNRPSLIHWGGPKGFFERRPVELPTYGSSGSAAVDYDGDGWLDLFITNHRMSGSYDEPQSHHHTCPSMLYWNGPGGFSTEKRWEVVGIGPSGLNVRDLGNSYDRGLYEDYISSIHAIPEGCKPSAIVWEAETLYGTAVQFQVRAAEDSSRLELAPWFGDRGMNTWFRKSGSKIKGLAGSWIQYQARLITPNGAATPYLRKVKIEFK